MTELHSAQRRSYTARTILGLLLAVVMVGAFATAGAAENTGTPRSGDLHVTKDCSANNPFQPLGFCTITGSNLNAIQAGMTVIYHDAAGPIAGGTDFGYDTNVVLDGPGNNDANGHVVLSFSTLTGTVTFSGGTGRFQGFDASAAVAFYDGTWHWDGTYSFTP